VCVERTPSWLRLRWVFLYNAVLNLIIENKLGYIKTFITFVPHKHTHTMNILINIFINGTWDTAHEDKSYLSPVIVYDKGTHVQILASQYDQYIDDLEERGYDCYLCPEMYSHPQWNNEIIYVK